jgi:hypothetical protein
MDLSGVYSKQVKPTAVTMLSLGAQAPIFERDPNLKAFEKNVFDQLRSVIPEEPIQNIDIPKAPIVKHVSFEDALRELTCQTHK